MLVFYPVVLTVLTVATILLVVYALRLRRTIKNYKIALTVKNLTTPRDYIALFERNGDSVGEELARRYLGQWRLVKLSETISEFDKQYDELKKYQKRCDDYINMHLERGVEYEPARESLQ